MVHTSCDVSCLRKDTPSKALVVPKFSSFKAIRKPAQQPVPEAGIPPSFNAI